MSSLRPAAGLLMLSRAQRRPRRTGARRFVDDEAAEVDEGQETSSGDEEPSQFDVCESSEACHIVIAAHLPCVQDGGDEGEDSAAASSDDDSRSEVCTVVPV